MKANNKAMLEEKLKPINPFMVTSNECYGLALDTLHKEDDSPSKETSEKYTNATTSSTFSQDLSFLMSRESDSYGDGIPLSDSALSEVFRQKESDSMNKRRKNTVFAEPFFGDFPTSESSSKTLTKDDVKGILSNYNHNPKEQHPLYVTETNEYGLRRPSVATFTTERYGLSQKFSQSFNRIMFRHEGLNASMTKSRIHDQLTP